LEGKQIGLDQEIGLKIELMILKPRQKLESKAESNSHIQFDSNETKLIPKNLDLDTHLKWALGLHQNRKRTLKECPQGTTPFRMSLEQKGRPFSSLEFAPFGFSASSNFRPENPKGGNSRVPEKALRPRTA
jgi:hypothetical protein